MRHGSVVLYHKSAADDQPVRARVLEIEGAGESRAKVLTLDVNGTRMTGVNYFMDAMDDEGKVQGPFWVLTDDRAYEKKLKADYARENPVASTTASEVRTPPIEGFPIHEKSAQPPVEVRPDTDPQVRDTEATFPRPPRRRVQT